MRITHFSKILLVFQGNTNSEKYPVIANRLTNLHCFGLVTLVCLGRVPTKNQTKLFIAQGSRELFRAWASAP